MRFRGGTTAAIVVLLGVTCACTSPSVTSSPSSPSTRGTATGGLASRATALDAAMTGARGSFTNGAFTAAVVTDSGTWTAALGADGTGTPLTPQTELAVGSITKTFTTAELMHLADTGAVDLDAPTSRYVTSPLTANGATVRQTLSMTSGIRDGRLINDVTSSVSTTPDEPVTTEQAFAYLTTSLAPIGAPGEYSNAGFLVLGEVVERVTGMSFAAAVRRDLLGPAGLQRTTVQVGETPEGPVGYPIVSSGNAVADGFVPDRATATLAASAGSIAADASDVARWGHRLYVDHSVVPAADVTAMTTADGLQGRYGLGTSNFPSSSTGLAATTFGHNGAIYRLTVDGTLAMSVSIVIVAPEQGISVAVLAPSNADEPTMEHTAAALVRAAGGH